MAMPQRDDPPTPRLRRTGTIEAIKRLEPPSRVPYGVPGALLEYAVMHIRLHLRRQVARRSVATEPRSGRKRPSDEEETERIREELRKLTESV